MYWNIRHIKKSEEDPDVKKYLLYHSDNKIVEVVLMKNFRRGKNSICISTHVGCPLNCLFCQTGKEESYYKLNAKEILEQIDIIEDYEGINIEIVGFAGMGEPLLNIKELKKSIKNIDDKTIHLFTIGKPSKIDCLTKFSIDDLLISLHAPSDNLRRKLIPYSKRYKINDLINSLKSFKNNSPETSIFFEYLLFKDMNDSNEDLDNLIYLCKNSKTLDPKVHLKYYNETESSLHRSSFEKYLHFLNHLRKNGIECELTASLGKDIEAGCGQLKKQVYG